MLLHESLWVLWGAINGIQLQSFGAHHDIMVHPRWHNQRIAVFQIVHFVLFTNHRFSTTSFYTEELSDVWMTFLPDLFVGL